MASEATVAHPAARPRRPARWQGVYHRFRAVCLARVLLLAASLALFLYLLQRPGYPASTLVLALVCGLQVWGLIRYLERTNRELSRFFLAIRHADFSQSFGSTGRGAAFDELQAAFSEVLDAFRATRAAKEEQARYLETVVQHVGVGLLAYDGNGQVELINTAAKRLLRVNRLRRLDELEGFSAELVRALRQMRPHGQALVKVTEGEEVLQLAVRATSFRLREREYRLVSLQNIQGELEEQEMEAWQNLIRVLTHEIMNSITPISSLAATAHGLLLAGPLEAEETDDVRQAVHTIHERSEGLLRFVQAYRDLTRQPVPEFRLCRVTERFAAVQQLLEGQLRQARVEMATRVEPAGLEVTADPELLEQILINLVRNAVEALIGRSGARLELRGHTDGRGRVVLEVADNGPGIVEEALPRVFIPFFTTKPEGTGIGLSLCRQLMRLHRGSITVRSHPERETVFTLRF
jgi:nitrogen fixation/metabolism regulation signal transduction histidine kinase